MTPDKPTPVRTAAACGLNWKQSGEPGGHLTWDLVLELACRAYWARRPGKQAA